MDKWGTWFQEWPLLGHTETPGLSKMGGFGGAGSQKVPLEAGAHVDGVKAAQSTTVGPSCGLGEGPRMSADILLMAWEGLV